MFANLLNSPKIPKNSWKYINITWNPLKSFRIQWIIFKYFEISQNLFFSYFLFSTHPCKHIDQDFYAANAFLMLENLLLKNQKLKKIPSLTWNWFEWPLNIFIIWKNWLSFHKSISLKTLSIFCNLNVLIIKQKSNKGLLQMECKALDTAYYCTITFVFNLQVSPSYSTLPSIFN